MGPDGALYFADWSNIIIQHGEVDFRDERRDQTHGRIWRVTAKGQPLTKSVSFSELSMKQLLENLKSDDRYITDMTKRVLIERGAQKVTPHLSKWLAKGQNEYTKLQALWLRVGLNSADPKLLKEVLTAKDYRIRAAAVRVAAQQYTDQPDILDLFKTSIKDSAAIVRLETVNALRELKSTEAVEVAMQALDSEVDKTIDYALVLTVREMAEQWIGKTIFNGNTKHLAYAVNASRNPKALSALYKAYKAGKISPDGQAGALKIIGELGNVQQLTELYNLATSDKTTTAVKKVILVSLLTSSRARGIKPKVNFKGLAEFMKSPALMTETISLIGAWKVKSLTPKLKPLALKGNPHVLDTLALVKVLKPRKSFWKLSSKIKQTRSLLKLLQHWLQ